MAQEDICATKARLWNKQRHRVSWWEWCPVDCVCSYRFYSTINTCLTEWHFIWFDHELHQGSPSLPSSKGDLEILWLHHFVVSVLSKWMALLWHILMRVSAFLQRALPATFCKLGRLCPMHREEIHVLLWKSLGVLGASNYSYCNLSFHYSVPWLAPRENPNVINNT